MILIVGFRGVCDPTPNEFFLDAVTGRLFSIVLLVNIRVSGLIFCVWSHLLGYLSLWTS